MLAHACMRARAAIGGGRPAPVPGTGSGPGLGSGSLPGLVLFESGLASMGCDRTKPAPLRIRTARQRLSANGSEPPANGCLKTVWAFGQLGGTVATVLSEPPQLLEIRGPECPSRSAINSALVSLSQTHQQQTTLSLSFYLSSEAEASLRSEIGSRVPKRLPARSGNPKQLPKEILQNSF